LFLFNLSAFPQTFGIGGGISTIQSPDSYTDDPGGIGLSAGYNIVIKLKFDIPSFPIIPVGFITYYHFSSDESRQIKSTLSVSSIGAGGEYKIIHGPLSPYIASDIAYNIGNWEFNMGNIETGTPDVSTFNTRIGVAVGIGAELTMLPLVGVDASIKYHLVNWIGQDNNEELVKVLSYNLIVLF